MAKKYLSEEGTQELIDKVKTELDKVKTELDKINREISFYSFHALTEDSEQLMIYDTFCVSDSEELVTLLTDIENNSGVIQLTNKDGGTWNSSFGYPGDDAEDVSSAILLDGISRKGTQYEMIPNIVYFITSDYEDTPNFYKIGIEIITNEDEAEEAYTFAITNVKLGSGGDLNDYVTKTEFNTALEAKQDTLQYYSENTGYAQINAAMTNIDGQAIVLQAPYSGADIELRAGRNNDSQVYLTDSSTNIIGPRININTSSDKAYYNDKEIATVDDIPTLSGLGGIGTITASGTSPLTLSASKSGTSVSISGSVNLSSYATTSDLSAKQDTLKHYTEFSGTTYAMIAKNGSLNSSTGLIVDDAFTQLWGGTSSSNIASSLILQDDGINIEATGGIKVSTINDSIFTYNGSEVMTEDTIPLKFICAGYIQPSSTSAASSLNVYLQLPEDHSIRVTNSGLGVYYLDLSTEYASLGNFYARYLVISINTMGTSYRGVFTVNAESISNYWGRITLSTYDITTNALSGIAISFSIYYLDASKVKNATVATDTQTTISA